MADFEMFKSNVCHRLKALGYKEFLIEVLSQDEINKRVEAKEWVEAFYLLAFVDYVSKQHNIPLCTKYDHLRQKKLPFIAYPRDIEMLSILTKDNKIKEEAYLNSIPEFKRYNIVERDIENVC